MNSDQGRHSTLLRHASVITAITILSRIVGYFRDQRITFLLGSGPAADAFAVAYRIPSLLRRLVSEGAITASFIPIFVHSISTKPKEELWEFTNALFSSFLFLLTAFVLIGVVLSPLWIYLTAFGFVFDPSRWALAVILNRIIFGYVIFIGLAALASGILNCFHHYAVPAFTPVLLNLSIIVASIVAGYFHTSQQAAILLAVGVVVGGIAQVVFQFPWLRRLGLKFRLKSFSLDSDTRMVLKSMLPGFIGVGVFHFGQLIDTQFASFLGVGSASSLYYADRVTELILGGYAISIATAVLPVFSEQAASGQIVELKRTLIFSIRIVCFITLPSMFALISIRRPIIEVLFQHGNFTGESTNITASVLSYFSIGLPFMATIKIIAPAFYAMKDLKTPVTVALISLGANILGAFSLVKPMGTGGLALSTSFALILNLFVLLVVFRRRFGPFEDEDKILAALGKMFFGSILLGAACYLMITIPGFYEAQPFSKQIWAFAATIFIGATSYLLTCWILKSKEMEEIWGIVIKERDVYRIFQ